MSSINGSQALSILGGSEGAVDNSVDLPVSKELLGKSRGKNKSGFSFGKVQLDIGNNPYARTAYDQILQAAVANGVISQDDADFVMTYSGVRRPDLPRPDMDLALAQRYREAIDRLNATMFDPKSAMAPQVSQIIAAQQRAYLDKELVPAVNRFLKSHTTGVFDPNDPNYATAVAALVAAKNRTGNLSRLTQLLKITPLQTWMRLKRLTEDI